MMEDADESYFKDFTSKFLKIYLLLFNEYQEEIIRYTERITSLLTSFSTGSN